MKNLICFILLSCCALGVAAKDLVMLRNGLELQVYVVQVGNDKVVYKNSNKGDATSELIDVKDVYMIFYEKRGIVYFTLEGKRVSEDIITTKLLKKKDDAPAKVYLMKGKIIPAYNLQILENQIVFDRVVTIKRSFLSSKKEMSRMELHKDEVFLIKYKDGTKDIITEFASKEDSKVDDSEVANEESNNEKSEEKELQVVFHNVKSGDTLAKLAKRYNVTVDEIKEWNDLPEKLKPTARLQNDMQLMLYVEIVETEE